VQRRLERATIDRGSQESAFVLLGRLTPLVRSFVSIPAGVLEFPLGRYVVLSAIASLAWCLAFGIAGRALGDNWDAVHHAFAYADYAALAALAVVAALVLARRRSTTS
jgi:membrane protein DedA with SNARE-associated domain